MPDTKYSFKGQKTFEFASERGRVKYTAELAWSFLQYVLESRKLPIITSLAQFDDVPTFFLIAGTGLGKTYAMPLYLWFRQMYLDRYYAHASAGSTIRVEEAPRVWVIEPKIAIAQSLHADLNTLWGQWWLTKKSKSPSPLFGCKTKVDHRDTRSPIMFLTTGIFAIYARKGMFKSGRDVILIDEAHETLETDHAIELGIGICRASGVDVQYMSATIDSKGLSERLGVTIVEIPGKRYPIWRHNTKLPMEECIRELVGSVLVELDSWGPHFPRDNTEANWQIISAVTDRTRAKGMLIIVNSFASEQSDAKSIARLLQGSHYANRIEVGLLASEVLRDPRRKIAYQEMLERWKREKKRYVLIATSVVEMGVTLPDLDFIVTMDSTLDDSGELANSAPALLRGAVDTGKRLL